MSLWLYIKGLAKHWWALMSCAVFTGIGIGAAWLGKSNSWVVWASCIAGMFLFLVASFLAWKEEHDGRTAAEAQLLGPRPRGPEVVLSWGYPPGEDELQPKTEWDKKLLLENRGESDAYNLKASLHAGSQITATFEPVRELRRGEKHPLDVRLTGVPQGHERDFAMLYYNEQRVMTSLPADCVETENGELREIKIPMDVSFSGYGSHPQFCTHFRFVASYGLFVKAGVEMLHSEQLP